MTDAPRILVVDDNDRIHDDFRHVLTPPSHDTGLDDLEAELFGDAPAAPVCSRQPLRVGFASQGETARDMVAAGVRANDRFQVAFVDVRMPPGWDGIQTVRELWKVDRDLQVVLCTAFSDYSWPQMVEALEHAERFLLLKKPFEADEVLQMVSCLASKWSVIQTIRCSMDLLKQQVHERTKDLSSTNARLVAEMEHRQAVELELRHAQKMEAVGQLAAGVAHEINTPIQFIGDSVHFLGEAFDDLSALVGTYRELVHATGDPALRSRADQAEQTADLEFVTDNVQPAIERTLDGVSRVSKIVCALKSFSHAGSDRPAPVDLNQALLDTLVVAANEYKYVADVATDLGELDPVTCHVGDLNQVFLNLLVNAAHAIADAQADGERGRILVRSRMADGWVTVSISDSGTGIPEDVQTRIFDPFFTTKEVGRGTGQGLSISRNLVVDKHGGALTFDTRPGEGTTFHVRLPVKGAGAQAA